MQSHFENQSLKKVEFIDASLNHAQAAGELVRLDAHIIYGALGSEFIDGRHDALGGYGAWMKDKIENSPFARSVVIEKQFAGIAITHLTEVKDRLHLTFLYVDPAYQRQGIGSSLLQEVESFAKEQDFKAVSLIVFEGNPEARSLYERNGFEQIGIRDDMFFSSLGLGILMLKELDTNYNQAETHC